MAQNHINSKALTKAEKLIHFFGEQGKQFKMTIKPIDSNGREGQEIFVRFENLTARYVMKSG